MCLTHSQWNSSETRVSSPNLMNDRHPTGNDFRKFLIYETVFINLISIDINTFEIKKHTHL